MEKGMGAGSGMRGREGGRGQMEEAEGETG